MMSRDDNDIKLLSVNVRGMVKHFDRKLLRLDHLINKYQPDFIFLQETHFSDDYFAKKLAIQL